MQEYKIHNYTPVKSFEENKENVENQGSKIKSWGSINKKKALIKLNGYEVKTCCKTQEIKTNTRCCESPVIYTATYIKTKETNSYNVSEKIYSEIAKILQFSCVEIDFVQDENGFNWLASYDYKTNTGDKNITDINSGKDLYFAMNLQNVSQETKNIDKNYFYEDIFEILLYYDYQSNYKLIKDFNKMVILDALTGETDRHFENWGIYLDKREYHLLPFFDNSSCLLHPFPRTKFATNLMNKTVKEFKDYCLNSNSKIKYKSNRNAKHFDLITFLLNTLEEELKEDLIFNIKQLEKINKEVLKNIIHRIPEKLCSMNQKKMIIKYILIRKRIMLEMVDKI